MTTLPNSKNQGPHNFADASVNRRVSSHIALEPEKAKPNIPWMSARETLHDDSQRFWAACEFVEVDPKLAMQHDRNLLPDLSAKSGARHF